MGKNRPRNSFFRFKQFTVHQQDVGMKVSTDSCALGALAAQETVRPDRILDIGTGTGVLALMLAQAFTCPIDAVEIEPVAAAQAMANMEASPWKSRFKVWNMPIQAFAQQHTNLYDLVICNPPYFKQSLRSPVQERNLARHDETLTYSELLKAVNILLNNSGVFYAIIPAINEQDWKNACEENSLFVVKKTNLRSRPEKPVYCVIFKISKQQTCQDLESELTILESDDCYSPAFKKLLSEYYLGL
jgi:tRNA1Val (adenine37-N6)-methyltransferase